MSGQLPSEIVKPTTTDSIPQQGMSAGKPGDGSEVHSGQQNARIVEVPSDQEKVPFKEQVIGVAKKTRGTLLGKPDLKEEGNAILSGQTTHDEPKSM